jgi:hypothetical protein
MTTNVFSPLSFIAVFGSGIRDPASGMGKNQDPGSGIWDIHPGSATLILLADQDFDFLPIPHPGSSVIKTLDPGSLLATL